MKGTGTLRAGDDGTLGGPAVDALTSLHQTVAEEWSEAGQADLVRSLKRHPTLLRDRSLLLTLAVEEYRSRRQEADAADLARYCSRFRSFGGSIENTILKQLETQRYFDDNVDLSELSPPTRWPVLGDEFGNFRVVEELGFGSLAKVFLCAEKDVGDRSVAVKVSPHAGIEASILGRLDHPNIIPILSTGYVEASDLHYVCMPFCGRSTLDDLVDIAFENGPPRGSECVLKAANRWYCDGQQEPKRSFIERLAKLISSETYIDRVIRIAAQIADGLDHGHCRGILHGDLKPSNVLLTPAAIPLLLDFNLSQDFARSLHHRGGTLPYMPPEHLRMIGDPAWKQDASQFDPAPDIYSFGALLYELLAGVPPVSLPKEDADTKDVARALLEQVKSCPPPIETRNSLVPRRISAVVNQCLSFDARQRPASIAEMKRQLLQEQRRVATAWRRVRSRPVASSLVASTAGMLLVGAGFWYQSLPPLSLRAYEKGLALVAEGDNASAALYFTKAVEADPSLDEARYQRAVAEVRLGQIDLAVQDFYRLTKKGNTASMAGLGYCFNLLGNPLASVPWYHRALENELSSAAIYNNLGTAYLSFQNGLSQTERFRRAKDLLSKALSQSQDSNVIRLNLVRLAVEKSKFDPTYDPLEAWRQARSVLLASLDDQAIRRDIAIWYQAVKKWEQPGITAALPRRVESTMDSMALQAFEQNAQTNAHLHNPTAKNRRLVNEDPVLARKRYYLEPF
jgi:serine/threonine protein kinase/Flp pilus assembly protein TadD